MMARHLRRRARILLLACNHSPISLWEAELVAMSFPRKHKMTVTFRRRSQSRHVKRSGLVIRHAVVRNLFLAPGAEIWCNLHLMVSARHLSSLSSAGFLNQQRPLPRTQRAQGALQHQRACSMFHHVAPSARNLSVSPASTSRSIPV